jgi:hypothetical protein
MSVIPTSDFIRTHAKEKNDMSIKKKVTDFVRLEQGSIGKKAAMVTGAAMVAGVLAAAVNVGEAKASPMACAHTNYDVHSDSLCSSHINATNCGPV